MGDEQVQDQQTQAPAGSDVDEEITAEGAAFVHAGIRSRILRVRLILMRKWIVCMLLGWTKSTQHKLEDTWNKQRPVELIRGKLQLAMNVHWPEFEIFNEDETEDEYDAKVSENDSSFQKQKDETMEGTTGDLEILPQLLYYFAAKNDVDSLDCAMIAVYTSKD